MFASISRAFHTQVARLRGDFKPLLCANCFHDRGLQIMAREFPGQNIRCRQCGKHSNHGLSAGQLIQLCHNFFVRGSTVAFDYGAAPVIQFNNMRRNELDVEGLVNADIAILSERLGIGFFHYGPRYWMFGSIEPLRKLRTKRGRKPTINRILRSYPVREIQTSEEFYRMRKAPDEPSDVSQYDAPPDKFCGNGRLDSPDTPILYGSQDLEICVHECRFSAGDELFVSTLAPTRVLRLIDLTHILDEEGTEFDSLDLAVLMLFLAGNHAYQITRALAIAARAKGFDGIIYPSYFSILRTGSIPFETMMGISLRRIPGARDHESAKVIGNLALFGRPIAEGKVRVVGINRLVISRVSYGMIFGPVMTPD